MSLKIWLPLDSETNFINKGTSDIVAENHGATFGAVGKSGNTFTFDGSDDYISVVSGDYSTIFANDFSICMWILTDDIGSSDRGILFGNYNISSGFYFNLELRYGYLRFYWNNSPDWISTVSISSNIWTHLIFTKSGSTVKIYKDGVLSDTRTNVTTAFGTLGSNAFYLGRDSRTGATSYKGRLCDFRIYDHCLSKREAKDVSLGLICHYKLDGFMGGESDNLGLNSRLLTSTIAKTNKYFGNRSTTNGTIVLRSDGFNEISVTVGFGGIGIYANQLGFKVGQKYTYSFMAYHVGCTTPNISFYPMMYNSSGTRDTSSQLPIYVSSATTWVNANARAFGTASVATSPKKMWCAFEWNQTMQDIIDNGGRIELSIQGHGTLGGGTINIYAPKIEEGFNQNPKWNANSSETGENTTVYDSSGFGHTATAVGNISINADTSRNSYSTYFASGSYIKKPGFIYDSMYWTVTLWYYKPTNPTAYEILFCLSKGDGTDANKKICAAPNSGRIWYKGESGSGSISKLKIAEWTFLAMSCNGTITTIYENAQQIGTISAGTQMMGCTDLVLAARSSSTGVASTAVYYTGGLADFRIYSTPLSATDIKYLYETSSAVDKDGNVHPYVLVEDTSAYNRIKKTGVQTCTNVVENTTLFNLKYDNQIYFEPDGSTWVRVFHHGNPASVLFESTDTFATSVYKDENRWFNIEVCNNLSVWELMVKQKLTTTGTEKKFRWVQNANPMTATYANVAAANVTYNTSSGYTSVPSGWGGIHNKGSNTYIAQNNGTSSSWWGAIGSWTAYQGGIPGFGTNSSNIVTTGYFDLYVRIDNQTLTPTTDAKLWKNGKLSTRQIIEN